jgi:hypothetical protein
VQGRWYRGDGTGEMVQGRWCRGDDTGEMVQGRWYRGDGTGEMLQERHPRVGTCTGNEWREESEELEQGKMKWIPLTKRHNIR